jgi:hypothetical protein
MKWIFLLVFLLSCSSQELSTPEENEKKWFVLEQAIDNDWTQEKVLQELGEATEKSLLKGEEFWSYDNSKSESLEWTISFNTVSKKIMHITFSPFKDTRKDFTLDKVLTRWKRFNCQKKKELYQSTNGHLIKEIEYYICDGGKQISYNQYGEIRWIKITK